MKICIVGAGAIGGMLGVKLARSGHEITLILRGANLAAVQQNGLLLIEENGNELLAKPIRATSSILENGAQPSSPSRRIWVCAHLQLSVT